MADLVNILKEFEYYHEHAKLHEAFGNQCVSVVEMVESEDFLACPFTFHRPC